MIGGASLLTEAELHGLVDDNLEVERRTDVLRRLAASPADRALIEAWQDQNDLIHAAFRDVERETLPVALDLAPPRLRCIDGDRDRRLDRDAAPIRIPSPEMPSLSRRTVVAGAALLFVAAGLAGSWMMLDEGRGSRPLLVPGADAGLEATLAERATTALAATAPAGVSRAAGAAGPTMRRIPDLSAAGLRLTGVSTQPKEPSSMVLHYRDVSAGRVVLGMAAAPDRMPTPPTSIGPSLAWRRGGVAYALAGSLPPKQLRSLAESLQDETGQE